MSEKTVTFREFIQAIEDNGVPQAFGEYYEYDDDTEEIVAACALGTACKNLGISTFGLAPLNDIQTGLGYEIAQMNDVYGLTFKEIADKLRALYPNDLDRKLTFMHLV